MPVPKGTRIGGRQKGTPNKATADVKKAASAYTEEALETLASIMRERKQPAAARVSAAQALLDRAHGKPKQAIDATLDGEVGLSVVIKQFTAPAPDGD